MELEKLMAKLDWCKKYIAEFNISEEFDPYARLTDAETPKQEMYCECVDFVVSIAEYINGKCKQFDRNRHKILFGGK